MSSILFYLGSSACGILSLPVVTLVSAYISTSEPIMVLKCNYSFIYMWYCMIVSSNEQSCRFVGVLCLLLSGTATCVECTGNNALLKTKILVFSLMCYARVMLESLTCSCLQSGGLLQYLTRFITSSRHVSRLVRSSIYRIKCFYHDTASCPPLLWISSTEYERLSRKIIAANSQFLLSFTHLLCYLMISVDFRSVCFSTNFWRGRSPWPEGPRSARGPKKGFGCND